MNLSAWDILYPNRQRMKAMARPQQKAQMEEVVHILLNHPEIGEIERYRGN